jgi:hypothetical protein
MWHLSTIAPSSVVPIHHPQHENEVQVLRVLPGDVYGILDHLLLVELRDSPQLIHDLQLAEVAKLPDENLVRFYSGGWLLHDHGE